MALDFLGEDKSIFPKRSIQNLEEPSAARDAANKDYADRIKIAWTCFIEDFGDDSTKIWDIKISSAPSTCSSSGDEWTITDASTPIFLTLPVDCKLRAFNAMVKKNSAAQDIYIYLGRVKTFTAAGEVSVATKVDKYGTLNILAGATGLKIGRIGSTSGAELPDVIIPAGSSFVLMSEGLGTIAAGAIQNISMHICFIEA